MSRAGALALGIGGGQGTVGRRSVLGSSQRRSLRRNRKDTSIHPSVYPTHSNAHLQSLRKLIEHQLCAGTSCVPGEQFRTQGLMVE